MGVLGSRAGSTGRFRALIVPSIWAAAYLCTSTLVFGLTFGVCFAIYGAEGTIIGATGTDFVSRMTMAIAVYGYGVFAWNIVALMTLPVTLLPVVAWVALAKGYSWIEADRKKILAGTFAMAIIAFVVREAYLDVPSFWKSVAHAFTGRWASASYATSAIVSVWAGLALPRLCMPDLTPGVFAPNAHEQ